MDTQLSRRSFVTKAALAGLALVAAPIAMGSAQPKAAKAAVPTTPGTYTVSANLKIGIGTIPAIVAGQPYMTCLKDPVAGEGFPTVKATDNATLTVNADGTTGTLVLNQTLNRAIAWTIAGSCSTASLTPVWTATTYQNDDGEPKQRIDGGTFALSDLTGEYTFTGCQEYAAYSLLEGFHTWDITLIVEY